MSDKAKLRLNLYDGTRQLLPNGVNPLITIIDGQQNRVFRANKNTNSIVFSVPFYDNLFDSYTVIASADGYIQAGFHPVLVSDNHTATVDLMLLPRNGQLHFTNAKWANLKDSRPEFSSLLVASSGSESAAKDKYESLIDDAPGSVADFLNIMTSLAAVHLPNGTPIGYLKRLIEDDTMAQDRFFAYCDVKLIDQVRQAVKQGAFVPENGCGFFHPGATSSYKQVQFGEANVQITFHEDDQVTIDKTKCVKVEFDIDYYQDLAAHATLEVIPNLFTGGLTDPKAVYVLRWIAGRQAGVPDFDPLYTIE